MKKENPKNPIPDAEIATLIARRDAGEKLTPAEYGKLGASKARTKKQSGNGSADLGCFISKAEIKRLDQLVGRFRFEIDQLKKKKG